jgi:hypothetical protein
LGSVDAATLLDQASEQAGLGDWGGDSFREGLERLVGALDGEAGLNDLGVLAVEQQILANLTNRLRVTDWVRTHPVVLAEQIREPIVVLGLPRTGTTLLHELFHRDPANRSLMRWESIDSVPPPEAASFDRDPRIEASRAASQAMDALNPEFESMHYEAPDGPTECVAVLAQEFRSLLWSVLANIPSYTRWMIDADPRPAYAYHREVLQLLQSRAPGRWALKTPHHALFLDAVLAEYPDARLVMTHREPLTVVTSLCSLARSLGGTFSDRDHTAELARTWTDVAAVITDRTLAFRNRHGDARVVDVTYDELTADPIEVVGRVLDHFSESLSPAAEAAMRAYLADDPHRRFAPHAYRPADVGLDPDEIRERFGAYAERFGVQAPAARGDAGDGAGP